jgi:glycosyltransferase involved in cell wall biosynthesis
MVNLAVAIPTWRRWSFLEKALGPYLENDLIQKVVVCDETGEDVAAIKASRFANHTKLILHVNDNKLGMYHNKRKCLEVAAAAGAEWVSVIDSDNLFSDDFFETLVDAIQKENNIKTVFAATDIIHLHKKTGTSMVHTKQFAGYKITKKNWNQILQMPKWNFLLNDGNWTAHKDVLSCFNPCADEEQIRATDSLLLAKEMILGGFTYYVVPGLKYIHTVHDDSEWIKTEEISLKLLRTTKWHIEN